MKQFLICKIVLLLFGYKAIGQNYKDIKIGGGLSYLSTKIDSKLIPNSTQKFYWKPSIQFGYFYNYHLRKNSSIGAESLFIQINGREKTETKIIDQNGNPTGQLIIENHRRHISYLGMPLYYEHKIKKFTINLGIQFSLKIYSTFHFDIETPVPVNYPLAPSIILSVKHYDIGAKSGLSYSLSKRLSIETTFYYGFIDISNKNTQTFGYNNINEKNPNDLVWKIQQGAVAIRYKFFK